MKVIKFKNNTFFNIFKKGCGVKGFNDEINIFINTCEKRKIIMEVQIQISSLLDNERFKY